jgi:hypothetical protein
MTQEEAFTEFEKLLKEDYNEKQVIIAEAKKNGTWMPELDTNRELFKEQNARFKKKVGAIIAKINQ